MTEVKLSKRAGRVIASPMRKFYPLMRAAEERGAKVYKLNVGDPDIAPPAAVFRLLKNLPLQHINYAPSAGLPEHLRAWLKYFSHLKIKLNQENIIPTLGAAEGILISFLALTDPGDEVIVFEPLYTSYKGFAAMCNIKLVPITLGLENNFLLPKKHEILKKITCKTRAIVLINPDNPTGKVWTKKELTAIIQIARQHQLCLIVDETYREIVFQGKPISILTFKDAKDFTLVIDSLSKRFSLPGIRVGALISYNQKIMEAVLKLAMQRLSVPTLGQLITVPLLEQPTKYVQKITREYKQRREVVLRVLKSMPGVIFNTPQGAFYQIVRLPLKDSEEWVKFMLKDFQYQGETLLVTPMKDFYITPNLGRNEIRIAYILNVQALRRAMLIFSQGLATFLAKQKK